MAMFRRNKANAVLEYVVLIIVIIAAILTFRVYIQRAMEGQFRKTGESFGFLRQYNPQTTIDCAFNEGINAWYAQACFNNKILLCRTTADYPLCAQQQMNACKNGCAQN